MRTLTSITFDSDFLSNFTNLIFCTRMNGERLAWQKEWEILLNHEGDAFTDLEEAIEFIRTETSNKWGIGLATFEQAQMENAQWNNL